MHLKSHIKMVVSIEESAGFNTESDSGRQERCFKEQFGAVGLNGPHEPGSRSAGENES